MALRRYYHDSSLETVAFGPRREVILGFDLDTVWNPGVSGPCYLRFGDISNIAEVEAFFQPLAKESDGRLKRPIRVDGIVNDDAHGWALQLEGLPKIVIQSKKVTES